MSGHRHLRSTLVNNYSTYAYNYDYTASPWAVTVQFTFRSFGWPERFKVRRRHLWKALPEHAGVGRYRMTNGNVVSSNTNYFGLEVPVAANPDSVYAVTGAWKENADVTLEVKTLDGDGGVIDVLSYAMKKAFPTLCIPTGSDVRYLYANLYKSGGLTLDGSCSISVTEGVFPSDADGTKADAPTESAISKSIDADVQTTIASGYINGSGNIVPGDATNQEVITEPIPVRLYSRLMLGVEYENGPHGAWMAVGHYNASGGLIRRDVILNNWSMHGFGVVVDEFAEGAEYVRLTWRSFGDQTYSLRGTFKFDGTEESGGGLTRYSPPFQFKPVYDHLFLSDNPITVPHESLYHVRLSHRLGYNVIEANLMKTTDGVFVVNHLQSGKFGRYFQHVDGETDISDIRLDSKSWDWIVENVRYVSTIARYRTRPCRLEEFLAECRQNDVIPFVTSSAPEAIAIVRQVMGDGNFIAYNATRANCPNDIIYHYVGKTTKQEIIDYCESMGRPFIYGMSNPGSFTDAQLAEIVGELHARGYWIGVSYQDDKWWKYKALGFDVNGSQHQANRLDHGDALNATSVTDFSQFTVSGGTQTDDGLVFSSGGTIAPTTGTVADGVYVVDIECRFDGSITVPAIGELGSFTYTSDGSYPFFESVPVVGGNPVGTITVGSGTTIRDISYLVARA